MQNIENFALIQTKPMGAVKHLPAISSLRRFVRLKIAAPYVVVAISVAALLGFLIGRNTTLSIGVAIALPLALLLSGMAYNWAKRLSQPVEELILTVEQLAIQQAVASKSAESTLSFPQTITNLRKINVQIRQLAHLRTLLTRYLGGDIAERILDGETDLGGETIWATSLFADIRDFTSLTETTDLKALFSELNDYYAVLQRVINKHGGVINKFGGDSVLALFGAPTRSADHARAAVCAAGAIMDELAVLNEERIQHGRPPFRIGIGVNTGEMMIGNLGSEQRLEYTVLGDCVNVAKRLSDLSKETPFYSIYVGQESINAIESLPPSWEVDDWGTVKVKGRQQPIATFAVTPGEPFADEEVSYRKDEGVSAETILSPQSPQPVLAHSLAQ